MDREGPKSPEPLIRKVRMPEGIELPTILVGRSVNRKKPG
jgi:hypothetical protein